MRKQDYQSLENLFNEDLSSNSVDNEKLIKVLVEGLINHTHN